MIGGGQITDDGRAVDPETDAPGNLSRDTEWLGEG
jgi:hypothetical protein